MKTLEVGRRSGNRVTRRIATLVGLTMCVGVAVGVAVESHTNEVANAKARTAETCLEVIPHGDTVNKRLEKCLEDGVPGGTWINEDRFDVGDPVGLVDGYIQAQHDEADGIELGRLVVWSAVPFATAAGAVWIMG